MVFFDSTQQATPNVQWQGSPGNDNSEGTSSDVGRETRSMAQSIHAGHEMIAEGSVTGGDSVPPVNDSKVAPKDRPWTRSPQIPALVWLTPIMGAPSESGNIEHDPTDAPARTLVPERQLRPLQEYQSLAKLCVRFLYAHFDCRSVEIPVRVPSATAVRSDEKLHAEGGQSVATGRTSKPLTKPTYVMRYASRSINQTLMENFFVVLMYHTQLHECVTFAALMLAHRLRCKFPLDEPRSVYGHKLFIAAFVVAAKVICEGFYANGQLARRMSKDVPKIMSFSAHNLLTGEANVCFVLRYFISINPELLVSFTNLVKTDYAGDGPYPRYDSWISGGAQSTAPDAEDNHPSDEDSEVEI
ncbi:hypothetical protein DAEQUDRAFT_739620 [Daedalea quercina L-15889]|uniref:Cyclin N-terminal domain-containing protein n=1 Tax=Daedalea quercina L-15889 TaxID=1314783 RepID=A0A165NHJ0_9APHY|nr:hypothetical protein DAEQUDRAFT_739620 [Daedalea quercina L-15889]